MKDNLYVSASNCQMFAARHAMIAGALSRPRGLISRRCSAQSLYISRSGLPAPFGSGHLRAAGGATVELQRFDFDGGSGKRGQDTLRVI